MLRKHAYGGKPRGNHPCRGGSDPLPRACRRSGARSTIAPPGLGRVQVPPSPVDETRQVLAALDANQGGVGPETLSRHHENRNRYARPGGGDYGAATKARGSVTKFFRPALAPLGRARPPWLVGWRARARARPARPRLAVWPAPRPSTRAGGRSPCRPSAALDPNR
jgi:hypothetical protein